MYPKSGTVRRLSWDGLEHRWRFKSGITNKWTFAETSDGSDPYTQVYTDDQVIIVEVDAYDPYMTIVKVIWLAIPEAHGLQKTKYWKVRLGKNGALIGYTGNGTEVIYQGFNGGVHG